jgi:hypothetical protein
MSAVKEALWFVAELVFAATFFFVLVAAVFFAGMVLQ